MSKYCPSCPASNVVNRHMRKVPLLRAPFLPYPMRWHSARSRDTLFSHEAFPKHVHVPFIGGFWSETNACVAYYRGFAYKSTSSGFGSAAPWGWGTGIVWDVMYLPLQPLPAARDFLFGSHMLMLVARWSATVPVEVPWIRLSRLEIHTWRLAVCSVLDRCFCSHHGSVVMNTRLFK